MKHDDGRRTPGVRIAPALYHEFVTVARMNGLRLWAAMEEAIKDWIAKQEGGAR